MSRSLLRAKMAIPVGGGGGRVVRLGKLPINISAQLYYNVKAPDYIGDWSTRLQLQFMFPKK